MQKLVADRAVRIAAITDAGPAGSWHSVMLGTIGGCVRTVAGVRTTEAFVYLEVAEDTYQWETR